MTIQTLSALAITAVALAVPPPSDCTFNPGLPGERRVFTNADLDRMAACRRPSEVLSPAPVPSQKAHRDAQAAARPPQALSEADGVEALWRAQWRAVDQKVKKLRREAREMREEAEEAPRDPKKRPAGRRSPSLLRTRALALETEAKELEAEFEDRARRAGALPGWVRAKGR